MFYRPPEKHPLLSHNPLNALVSPRPIGWISTLDVAGNCNLAPYSYFNAVAADPPMVMFSSSGYKHTTENAVATGEFVVNIASYDLRHQVVASSANFPKGRSEARELGIAMTSSMMVGPPRVNASPAALECKYIKTVTLEDLQGNPLKDCIVIGQVIGIYVDDDVIKDGLVDAGKLALLARLGYRQYARIGEVFDMERPP